jgi:hypothetical protein
MRRNRARAGDFQRNRGENLIPVTVSWKAVDGFENVDNHIDPWSKKPNGKRIFPDAKDPDHLGIQDKLEVIVKTSPLLAGKSVYVHAFDVDDSTSEDFDQDLDTHGRIIDIHGKSGDDNLPDYKGTLQNGQFWAGSHWGGDTANGLVDANGETKFIFGVGMQPGNNYRIVASVINESMYDGVQTSNSTAAKYLGAELGQNGGAPSTPLLTVWRRLWVENDSMEAIPFDSNNLKKNDLSHDISNPTINSVALDSSGANTEFRISGITDVSSFSNLENGRIVVLTNSPGDPGPPIPTAYPVIGTAILPNGSQDIDVVSVQGDQTAVPAGAGYRLYDDDDFGMDSASLTRNDFVNPQMKNYFKTAFIEVIDAAAFNPRTLVTLHLNEDVSTNLYGLTSTVVADAVDLLDKNECWICPITAAYQGPEDVDCDPQNGENLRLGESAVYGDYDHSTVFVEGCRETFNSALRSPLVAANAKKSLGKWIIAAASHEMGHQPGIQTEPVDHAELGLMAEGLNGVITTKPEDAKFLPKTILRFRKSNRWSK